MRRFAVLALSFAAAAVCRPPAMSAVSWTPLGPEGGPVIAVARDGADPSRAWVSTGRIGVLRSIDGGRSWVPSNVGLPTLATNAIAGLSNGTLLLGTFGAGLFRSSDAGSHWSAVPGVPPTASVDSIAADPRSPDIVYAAGSALYQSRDGGLTWAALSHPGSEHSPVAVDPATSRVYAGTVRACPLASSDLGATWVVIGCYRSSSPLFLGSPQLTALLPDPQSPGTLYVSARDYRFVREKVPGGLFRSDDGGVTFVDVSAGLSSPVDPLFLGPDRSVNAILFGPDGSLFAGTSWGLFVSRDRAASWQSAIGFPPVDVRDLRSGPGPEMLAGTAARGVFASHDGGLSWEPSSYGMRAGRFSAVALDPRMPSTLWAGSADIGGGVAVSADGGATWDSPAGFPSTVRVESLAVDPVSSSHLFAGGSFDVPGIGTFGQLYTSVDRGVHWDRPPVGLIQGFGFDPLRPQRILAGGVQLHESKDSGTTWDLLVPGSFGAPVFDPEDPRRAYTSTHWSADGGVSWIRRDFPMPSVSGLAVAPGGVVYAGTASGVWRSDSHGLSFRAVNFGIENRRVIGLAVDRRRDVVFAAMAALFGSPFLPNLFESRDGGTTWIPAAEGLPAGEDVLALAVDPTSGAAYTATVGGIYRRIEEDAACVPGANTLCLGGGRFRAQVSWKTETAATAGHAIPLTGDAGAFWFFSENNIELVVKVVDGRAVNGNFWVFGAGLTDVAYDLAVTDTATGAVWTRHNAAGQLASYADTSAF